MSDKQGTFVWYELLTADVKKAIDFYGNVIGWGTQPFGESYNMWTAGKTPIGGVMGIDDAQMHAGTKPHWWAHVLADDVDALTKKAASEPRPSSKTCSPPPGSASHGSSQRRLQTSYL